MAGQFIGVLILWLIVAVIVVAVAVWLLNWLYHRSTKDVSFVRTGLGGLRTLRGFKSDRFVGRVFGLANLELRWTFHRFEVLKQKFALIGVPFIDVGRTFDDLGSVTFKRWRRGQGAAFRVSWNLATIVTVEYGFSDEDTGLYINFAHIF